MNLITQVKRIVSIPREIMLYVENERIKKGKIKFNVNGLNKDKREFPEIIVSLTSYPGRIDIVTGTLASLLRQTFKPDRIILWLGEEKFPGGKLPDIYDKILESGIEIQFRKDLKSHTKYFYAMQENPEAIVITVDDDRIYSKRLVQKLIQSYICHPDMVSAMRVHKMKFGANGDLQPYNDWIYEYEGHVGTSSFQYFATGVGGVLYPPHCLHPEVFNLKMIKQYCHNHDDLWLKIMETLAGTRVVIAADAKKAFSHNIYSSQASGQYIENVIQGGNDRQTQAVLSVYNEYLRNGKTLLEVMNQDG